MISILDKKTYPVFHKIFCGAILFIFPFFFGTSIIFTGIIINFFLIYFAVFFKKKELFPLIFLPYFGKLFGLGIFTGAFIYMGPVIWLGNAILVFLYKEKPSLFLASFMKAFVIFFFSSFLLGGKIAVSFGILQFITAVLGGGIAEIFINFPKRNQLL